MDRELIAAIITEEFWSRWDRDLAEGEDVALSEFAQKAAYRIVTDDKEEGEWTG